MGLVFGLTVGAHGPAHRLGDMLETLDVGVWAVSPIAFDGTENDLVVCLLKNVEPQIESVHLAGRVILHDDVCQLDHPQEHLPAPFGFEVERHAALVSVEYQEIVAVNIRIDGPLSTSAVSDSWLFDLNHVGAHPRQDLGAGRACLHLGEIENSDAIQWAGHWGSSVGNIHNCCGRELQGHAADWQACPLEFLKLWV